MVRRNHFIFVYFFFLIIALGVFTFLVPPFRKFDETGHFLRVMTIASGQFTCRTDEASTSPHFTLPVPVFNFVGMFAGRITEKFPVSLYKQSYPYLGNVPTQDMSDECYFPSMGYIPQTLGAVASLPWNNLLVTFYFTRIAAEIFFLTCFIVSIHVIPKRYQLLLMLVGALPTVLHQVTIVSYDSTIISLSLLIFALFTRYLDTKKLLPVSFVLFVLLTIYAVSAKPGYYFFALLPLFLIPKLYVPVNKTFLLSAVLLCFILGMLYVVPRRIGQLTDLMYLRYQVSVTEPKYFLSLLFTTLTSLQETYVYGMFTTLGWFEYNLPVSVFVLYMLLFGFAGYRMFLKEKKLLSLGWSCVLFGIVIASVVLLFYLFFVHSTPFGQSYISGIQGRYFIPFILFAVFAMFQIAVNLGRGRAALIGFRLASAYVLYAMIATIYIRYYDYTGLVTRDLTSEQVTDVPISLRLDASVQHRYPVSAGEKIGGFQLVLANEKDSTVSAAYRYAIKDSTCTDIVYRGFFSQEKTQGSGIYVEYFRPIAVKDKNFCMEITPLPMRHQPVFLTVASDGKNAPLVQFLYQLR